MFLIGSNNQNQEKDLDNIIIIIWLSLFSPCDWSICRPYVPVRTKISKSNAHFAALSLFISKKKKGLKKVTETSVKHEDLDPPNFNLCLFVNEAGEEETESSSYRIKKTLPETNERKLRARHNVQFSKDSSVTSASEYLQCY